MTRKRHLSMRISADGLSFYNEHFQTPNGGCHFAGETFPALFRSAMKEMTGTFTEDELKGILSALSGFRLHAETAGRSIFSVLAHPDMDNWGVSVAQLARKLRSLPQFNLVCLEIWVAAYWLADSRVDLDDHINRLMPKEDNK